MDLKQLTRDAAKVHAHLKEMEDGSVITTKGVKIYSPTRFRDKNLANIGNEIYIVGIFMVTVADQFYAVEVTNAMMRIEPSSVNNVSIQGKEHFEFVFEPGDTVFPSTELVREGKLLYYIFEEIIGKGNVPPFMDYMDIGRLFSTAQHHAGVTLASTPTVLEMLMSMICRDPKSPMTYFRQITNGKDFDKVMYVPLRSPIFGATNTTSKILGAYFGDSLTSALVNPSEEEEDIESILRQ